jgi:hypothetical protein
VKRIHLLRVEGAPPDYAALIEAIRADGGRVGWLELEATDASTGVGGESASPTPPRLEQAADLGVLRAVAVGHSRTVSVKPRVGGTVIRDLLREHFRGCRLVLVKGAADAPALVAVGDAWTVRREGAERSYGAESLARVLRKPDPFGEAASSKNE